MTVAQETVILTVCVELAYLLAGSAWRHNRL